jgi:hypothetical protein
MPNSAPATKTIQEATIEALERWSNSQITVEAWKLAQLATEPCSHDHFHGKGTCYGPTGDPLCLPCQIAWIAANAAPGAWLSIDVAR